MTVQIMQTIVALMMVFVILCIALVTIYAIRESYWVHLAARRALSYLIGALLLLAALDLASIALLIYHSRAFR